MKAMMGTPTNMIILVFWELVEVTLVDPGLVYSGLLFLVVCTVQLLFMIYHHRLWLFATSWNRYS